MQHDPAKVYLYRTDIDTDTAPFERYRTFAREALGRLDLDLPAAGPVVLKPNVTITAPADSRIVTHPGFVAGLVDALRDKGVEADRLLVGEGHGPGRDDHAQWAGVSGYTEGLKPLGLGLVDLDVAGAVDVEVPGGGVFERLRFCRQVTECAYYLNVPVAKCHNLSLTTLAMKNTQGTVTSPQRHMCTQQAEDQPFADRMLDLTVHGISLHEERFCHKQADKWAARLHLGIPQLSVIDGLIGRDGTGFNEGRNRPLGWTLLGSSEVRVDVVGTWLMGLEPTVTPYLQIAAERGLGSNRIEDVDVVDLASGATLSLDDLRQVRSSPPLMPLHRANGGHAPRFRADGSLVPWMLDAINERRQGQGQRPIAA